MSTWTVTVNVPDSDRGTRKLVGVDRPRVVHLDKVPADQVGAVDWEAAWRRLPAYPGAVSGINLPKEATA